MSGCPDNQDVGSEAATIERVRNSSLVKCSGADNVAGLESAAPKPWDVSVLRERCIGRGAFAAAVKVDRKDGWSAAK
jgi:hypothetical protein